MMRGKEGAGRCSYQADRWLLPWVVGGAGGGVGGSCSYQADHWLLPCVAGGAGGGVGAARMGWGTFWEAVRCMPWLAWRWNWAEALLLVGCRPKASKLAPAWPPAHPMH